MRRSRTFAPSFLRFCEEKLTIISLCREDDKIRVITAWTRGHSESEIELVASKYASRRTTECSLPFRLLCLSRSCRQVYFSSRESFSPPPLLSSPQRDLTSFPFLLFDQRVFLRALTILWKISPPLSSRRFVQHPPLVISPK